MHLRDALQSRCMHHTYGKYYVKHAWDATNDVGISRHLGNLVKLVMWLMCLMWLAILSLLIKVRSSRSPEAQK